MSLSAQLLAAGAACVGIMALLWLAGRRIRNWSVVDPGWAFCIVVCAGLYAATSPGAVGPRVAAATCAAAWGLRHVVLLLVHRVLGQPEEGRYVALRARFGPGAFFLFFQAQALLAFGLSVPFLLASRTSTAGVPVPAILVFAVGFVGEAVADAQLAAWKRDPANRGRTCRRGLWSWSRHPNYFFEAVLWGAFALLAAGHPDGVWAWTAPATILGLLLFVTGIPPSEAQALRSRGDDYRAYRRTTSAFVPLPPRRDPGPSA